MNSQKKNNSRDLLSSCAQLVGDHNLIIADHDMQPFLTEPRGHYETKALAVARPKSTDEVVGLINIARKANWSITPQGGNTGLVGGQVPLQSQNTDHQSIRDTLVINMSRMTRLRDIDISENTITVEAGCTLEQAQNMAESHDLLFPLSLASQGSCQIGGNIATNAGGTSVLAYGNMRNLTLGQEVVLANGQCLDLLSGLRKDNAGYDLQQLFIGAEGTLGITTAAKLKLYPRPDRFETAIVAVQSPTDALHIFRQMSQDLQHRLTTFEILPQLGLELVTKHFDHITSPLSITSPWYLLIEISLTKLDRDILQAQLERLVAKHLIMDAVLAQSIAQKESLWALREHLPHAQTLEGGSIKHDVSVPIERIPQLIERGMDALWQLMPDCRPMPFGHMGDGNLHFNISQPIHMEKQAFIEQREQFHEIFYDIVLDLGGSIAAEHGIGQLKVDLLRQAKPKAQIDAMKAVKASLDPQNIMNPGKII